MTDSANLGPIQPKRGIPEIEPKTPEGELSGKQLTKSFQLGNEGATQAIEQAPSPMELAQSTQGKMAEFTPDSMRDHISKIQDQVNDLGNQLTQKRVDQLTDAQKALLQTKVGQFHKNVRALSQRFGMNYKLPKTSPAVNELAKFLDLLTKSQDQLQTVGTRLQEGKDGKISPAGMIRAQAQLMAADRSVNFATAVISKGTDFIKQIFQTQI